MNIQALHTLNSEIYLTDHSSIDDFLRTQSISEAQYERLISADRTCLKVHVEKGMLKSLEAADEFNVWEIEMNAISRSFRPGDYPEHEIRFLTPSVEPRKSWIGGRPKDGFIVPDFEQLGCPFQFIAHLDTAELGLSWIPFESLGIVYLLYTGMGPLYLDYTDPLAPVVINKDLSIDHVYGRFTPEMHHIFERHYLKTTDLMEVSSDELFSDSWYEGITGVPFWIQGPWFLKCPWSNRTMQFVAQFTTEDRIKVSESTMASEKSYFTRNAAAMDFWGGGSMYVFMEPTTRVVAIFIQST